MARRGRKKATNPSEMATLPPPSAVLNAPTPKQIPLLCSVCPETPRFSDVSHLLTHIASKGHLHHETQTRLKAHQDFASSMSLQQYEQWYRENGIEALLVDRMKAKQVKEAAKTKRSRASSSAPPTKGRKKPKRTASNTAIKAEQEEFMSDLPIFPGFFQSDNDTEIVDDFMMTRDMLSLKGQVWPGMGKMDLANDEMKRTRNQRKPKSVVEKMRRTSEGIEPTQVVMTPQFNIERVKGVYDEDSPVSDQEEPSPPRKTSRQRRKKAEPLAEISVNIPRSINGHLSRDHDSLDLKASKAKIRFDQEFNPDIPAALGPFRPSNDVFRDEDNKSGLFENGSFATSSEREQRFDIRDHFAMPTLNPISNASLASPTPPARDGASRNYQGKEEFRSRFNGSPYFGSTSNLHFGSFPQQESPYTIGDGSMYQHGARIPFSATCHYNNVGQSHYRMVSSNQAPIKHDDYSLMTSEDTLAHPGQNLFLNMHNTNTNPLFSNDRMFLNSYNKPTNQQSLSPLGFTTANRNRERSYSAVHDVETQEHIPNGIKVESQLCESLEHNPANEAKDDSLNPKAIWPAQGSQEELDVHENLQVDGIEI